MYEPQISLSGNIAFTPSLRTTANGTPVLDLRLASSPRIEKDGEWVSGETLWFDVVCWKQLADNVSTTLQKGDSITVHGKLGLQSYEHVDKETGEVTTRTKHVIRADSVGLDLSRHSAEVKRVVRVRPEEAFGDRFSSAPQTQADQLAEDVAA